jgi:flagellin
MSLGINTNIASLSAQRALSTTQSDAATAMQRLSTGLRINSAKDDAAGLAISNQFTTQIQGMQAAARNANDAVAMLQTAEGGLSSMTDNLLRIRELAVQAASDSLTSTERGYLNDEVTELRSEINRVANATSFGDLSLLSGDAGQTAGTQSQFTFQVGHGNNSANDRLTVNIADYNAAHMGTSGETAQVISGTSTKTDTGNMTSNSSGDLTVATANGVAQTVAATTTATTFDNSANTARDLINNINSAVSGITIQGTLTASEVDFGSVTIAGTQDATDRLRIDINGQTSIDIYSTSDYASGSAATDLTTDRIVSAYNNHADTVGGVVASKDGTSLQFTAADGRNLEVTLSWTDNITTANALTFGDGSSGTAKSSLGGIASLFSTDGSFTIGGTRTNTNLDAGASSGHGTTTSYAAGTGVAVENITVSTQGNAQTAIIAVDNALDTINSGRASLGAAQSRFESTIENLNVSAENAMAARSRVLDADFAQESAMLAKTQVLQQAGISVLAQANAMPQQVLALLQ